MNTLKSNVTQTTNQPLRSEEPKEPETLEQNKQKNRFPRCEKDILRVSQEVDSFEDQEFIRFHLYNNDIRQFPRKIPIFPFQDTYLKPYKEKKEIIANFFMV